MRRLAFVVLALAAVAAPAPLAAQARPVIAVLPFDNNSIGKDRADYDGIGRGMADMLITDMASNPAIVVVERERIQALLTEQNLVKSGSIDPQTAIRLGKMIGAQYMITGGFMSDGRGTFILTARAINVEQTTIVTPVRLTSRGDDVLGLMTQLSNRLNSQMKLPALQVGDAGAPVAMPAGQPAAAPAPVTTGEGASAAAKPAPAAAVAAEPKAPAPAREVAVAAKPRGKMDMRTALLYSKALEEDDAGNRAKAVELYRQVVARFPLPAAQAKIDKYTRG